MSKVTIVYYGFVIPKNKCVKKRQLGKLEHPPEASSSRTWSRVARQLIG
jgi:hypothetical protein